MEIAACRCLVSEALVKPLVVVEAEARCCPTKDKTMASNVGQKAYYCLGLSRSGGLSPHCVNPKHIHSLTSNPFNLSEVCDGDLKPLQPVGGVASRPSTPFNLSEVCDEDLKPLQPGQKCVIETFYPLLSVFLSCINIKKGL